MLNRLATLASLLCMALVSCAAPAADRPTTQSSETPERPKVLVVGQPRAREGFAPWFMRGSGQILQYEELHSQFLVGLDAQGKLEGRLAERLPSLDDGTISILDDGRMRTTWKLRSNVKWHDGLAFTAEDVTFGLEVARHPEVPVQQDPAGRAIETIETLDSLTMAIIYKQPFFRALDLGFRSLYPLPRHLLASAFAGDKTAFMALPYFSNEYVHTGPFRVVEFVPGESVRLERFNEYFRGRPKLSAVVLRFIGDDNAMVSNMLAGEVDLTAELPTETVLQLRDAWKQAGTGYVLSMQGRWRFISSQFHPEWGDPPELGRDVRVRRGLLLGIDRETLRESLLPGFPDTAADTFMLKGDARASAVGTPFAGYRYDPSRAAQELEAGWRRGPGGRLLNRAGEQVRLEIRTTPGFDVELAAVANDWRKLGIDVAELVMTRALSQDREYIARFPGAEITAQGAGDSILPRFDSRLHPLPENRYVGSNGGHYTNPRFDQLLDRLSVTMDQRAQGAILKEMGGLLAEDLPGLPLYFSVLTLVALNHVRGVDDYPFAPGGPETARNAHLWDRS